MIKQRSSTTVRPEDDPLSAWNEIPTYETDEQRQARLKSEAEAKLISDKIDEELKIEKQKLHKSKGDVKLLLLGQAESGKSTLQKQFQLMYSPKSIEAERGSWRAVIYFNVVRSLKQVLYTLAQHEDTDDGSDADSIFEGKDDIEDGVSVHTSSSSKRRTAFTNLASSNASSKSSKSPISPSQTSLASNPTSPKKQVPSNQIANLRLRLSPLVSVEEQLALRLSGGASAVNPDGEVFVRSGWQSRAAQNGGIIKGRRSKKNLGGTTPDDDPLLDDVAAMLEASKDDIKQLWDHPTVVSLVTRRKLKLDEWSEFFMNDIMRIARHGYLPTTDDILHARIQTMGVAEHTFDVDVYGKSVAWHLYDVGGARGQRHSWVPYFDTANAIIFVAPISAFDQYLEEDPRINRIDDSLQLFTQICANPLLKKVHLVLFLNKTDILRSKLAKGQKVNKYILSFGERQNEYEVVVQYFRAHFLQVHRRNNENRRVLYTHLTSVVDTKTTQSIIGNVRDSIFRTYLSAAALV